MTLARASREARLAQGLSQTALAHRVGVARSYIAAIELGRANPTIEVIVRLTSALVLELDLQIRPPVIVGDRRQRDAVHARCSGYVDRRMHTAGLEISREVPIVDGRWRGWIDLLAFDRRTATLIIIEIKTVIEDLGALERQIGWYERQARRVARGSGWNPRRIVTWLLVLGTEANEVFLHQNRDALARVFRVPAPAMTAILDDPSAEWPGGRGLACIEPSRRGRIWMTRPRIHGGRTRPRHADYRDAATRLGSGRAC